MSPLNPVESPTFRESLGPLKPEHPIEYFHSLARARALSTSELPSFVFQEVADLATTSQEPPEALQDRLARAVSASPPSRPHISVNVTQRWEGVVTDVGDTSFWGELFPVDSDDAVLEVELRRDALSHDDESLLVPGAYFYLNVGYVVLDGGRKSSLTAIRFRRMPQWRQDDLDFLKSLSTKRRAQMGFDGTDDPSQS